MSKWQIGTSGWVYKHWMDIFYPPHLLSLNLILEAGKERQTLPLLIVKNLFLYFNQIR